MRAHPTDTVVFRKAGCVRGRRLRNITLIIRPHNNAIQPPFVDHRIGMEDAHALFPRLPSTHKNADKHGEGGRIRQIEAVFDQAVFNAAERGVGNTCDPETYSIDDEYLFCDDLLVAPIIGTESDEREVYLPAGTWVDFYTGEAVAAGRFIVCTEKIPVYRRIG